MRTRIKVTDLNLRQWDYLTTEVPVTGRTFLPGLPTACVVFELTPDFSELHIEMDLAEFTSLMTHLGSIRNEVVVTAQAALTPDALPDHLEDIRNAADPQRAAERAACPDGIEGCLADHSQTTRPV